MSEVALDINARDKEIEASIQPTGLELWTIALERVVQCKLDAPNTNQVAGICRDPDKSVCKGDVMRIQYTHDGSLCSQSSCGYSELQHICWPLETKVTAG